ncbi:MAG TPA: protein kinase [Gemmataceae bacterium]|nr:protein kinase [Gemmataceae bacterium]
MISSKSHVSGDSWRRREATYDRFEQEWLTKGEARIEEHLPPDDDPDRPAVLSELVRIEIELRRARGEAVHHEDYRGRFPTLPSGFPANDTRLGRYELFERLGRGGFAAVFRAHDSELARDVAVKVPAEDLLADPEVRSRIAREARSAAQLRHPGIVPLHEVGQDGAKVWLVYEYVPGPTLAALLRQTRPAPRQSALWIAQLAEALDYAHRAGIIHRDLKPANVIMRAGAEPVLTDFGLALHTEDIARLTRSGDVIGTPAYMSPEQASGRGYAVDGRSDIYSLGAMLYEMLTGQLPFRASTPAVLHQVIHDEPTPLRTIRTDVPLDLETICLKAMAKDPVHRYATAGQFADDLKRYLNHQPIRARRIGPLGQLKRWVRRNPSLAGTLSVALIVIIAVAGFSYWRVSGERDRYRLERDRAQALAANLALDRGLSLCEQGEVGPGLLWMVRSLELSPTTTPDHERVARLNFAAWAAEMPECIQVLPHPSDIRAIAFDPADGSLLTAGADARLVRWNPSTGRSTVLLASERTEFYALALSADGSTIAVGNYGNGRGTLILRRGAPPESATTLREPNHVTALAHHPTRPLILVGNTSSTAQLLSTTDGRPAGADIVHGGRVECVAFSPDGKSFVTGSRDQTVRLMELESGRTVATLEHPGVVTGVTFSPDSRVVATASEDNHVRLWDANTGKLLFRLVHHGGVHAVAFSPDGRCLLTGSRDRQARLWDVRTGALAFMPIQHANHVAAVAFAPDGGTFATASEDHLVRIWRRPQTTAAGEPLIHAGTVWAVAYSPDGKLVLTGSGERGKSGEAVFWDAMSRSRAGSGLPHDDAVSHVAFNDDGGLFLTGTYTGKVRLWDSATRAPRGEPIVRDGMLAAAVFVPNGQTLALSWGVAHGDRSVIFFDRNTGQPTGTKLESSHVTRTVAFSRDGRLVLTGGYDRMARLWDVATGNRIGDSLKHFGSVGASDLTADGKLAVTGTDDNWGQIWLRDGDEFRPGPRLPHRGTVRAVAFSPSTDLVLTGSWDKTAHLWDTATGRPIGPPLRHSGEIESVAFHPDGRTCASGGWDRTARFWRVPMPAAGSIEELRRTAEVLSAQQLGSGDSPRLLESADWLERFRQLHSP